MGFTEFGIEPVETTDLLGGGGTLDDSLDFLLGMGMVRGLLGRLDEEQRSAAVGEIRTALADRFDAGIGVRDRGRGLAGISPWVTSRRLRRRPPRTTLPRHPGGAAHSS